MRQVNKRLSMNGGKFNCLGLSTVDLQKVGCIFCEFIAYHVKSFCSLWKNTSRRSLEKW